MQVIPGIRVDGILDRYPNAPVIAVLEAVGAVLVVSENDLRAILSEDTNDLAEEYTVCIKLAVRVTKHHDVADSDRIGRCPLFGRSNFHDSV
jgi:hypothetical protein